ncbi:hypothetical protein GCM10007242_08710 [Pigmentiphaga litoralis]|jgi:uncharacterized protein (TIGR00369 family)|uniref:PaaI family thioesterase n=1 Tax=Pigmentiphaga litoralis TaxID=516702 RepID=UPI0016798584|nr:PaaI family thioesterase [Pigmentiphaga litoralis]GGX05668.1 hypothetical protein GCM10007242_08710 [Pigmentiphaga litoralis]
MTSPAEGPLTPPSIPFLDWLGGEFVIAEAGRCEIRLAMQPHHQNSWHVGHGGVIMTLLDVAMANAARSAHPERPGAATVEMKTTFVRPGKGAVLVALGHCYHRSTTMAFCDGELLDKDGALVAKGTGTFKFIRKSLATPQR